MNTFDVASMSYLKYNNMVYSNKYSIVDQKDTKIITLTTKITDHRDAVNSKSAHTTTSSNLNYNQKQGFGQVDKITSIES